MISNMDYSSKLLDLNMLVESVKDTRIAILRRVSYRHTTEGRPFFRLVFADANGFSVIGRMFGITDYEKTGRIMNVYIGRPCLIDFETDFSLGEVSLKISKINKINDEIEANIVGCFSKNGIAVEELSRKFDLEVRQLSAVLPEYLGTYLKQRVSGATFALVSEEDIGRGVHGAILEPLLSLMNCSTDEVTLAVFLLVLERYHATNFQSDAFGNISFQKFISLCVGMSESLKMLEPEPQAFDIMLIVSDFAGLFTSTSKVISPATKVIYDVYRAFVGYSDMHARTQYLPPQGFIKYGNYTLRK